MPPTSGSGARQYGPALQAAYELALWLIPTVQKFPRDQRFLLGDRIQTLVLDLVDDLIEATFTREPRGLLRRCNLRLEKLRFLLRLAKDLHHLDLRRYEFGARATDDIGRRVGGWVKATGDAAPPL